MNIAQNYLETGRDRMHPLCDVNPGRGAVPGLHSLSDYGCNFIIATNRAFPGSSKSK